MDLCGYHFLHTPPPPPPPSVSDCPVNQPDKVPSDDDLTDNVSDHLLKLGFSLKREKVADCLRLLGDLLNGFEFPKKAEICSEKFLFSNLRCCGGAILPSPVELKLKTTLGGPLTLQVDEFVNILTPPDEQQGIPPPGIDRMLFLTMTDGVHTVRGMACAPLGLKVGADEYGYMLADILKENNVDISSMRFDSNFNNALIFVTLKADGDRKFLLFGNPSADMSLGKSELDHDLIKKAKIFHYGSIGLIVEQSKVAHLAALRIIKDSNCILSYDPKLRLALWPSNEAARSSIMSIWHLADVIKISEDEITFLIDRGDPYDDDVVLDKLFHPNLKLLIVTGGSEGCRYYTQGFKGKVIGVNVKPVDTTGVGDLFVSGILYNIASDPSIFEDEERLQKALYLANVCGAK